MLYDENKYFNDIDVMKNVYIFKYTENIYCDCEVLRTRSGRRTRKLQITTKRKCLWEFVGVCTRRGSNSRP